MKEIIFLLFFIILFGCTETPANKNNINEGEIANAVVVPKVTLNCQILHQGDCSYQLCETKGWLANSDSRSIGDSRILVIYKPDETINSSKPIGIYSTVIFKELYGQITLNKFLDGETKRAIDNGEKVIDGESIKTIDNKIAIVKKYILESSGEYFAIGYIDEPNYIIMVVFTSKDFNDYNAYYNSFKKIVQSYKYLGALVKEEK